MSETRGMIHPEAKFLYNSEPMKQNKLWASKIQWWDRYWIDIPLPKGRIGKKKADRS